MKTIAILSQKGGAGKTTLAVHLAVAAARAGHQAAIIDLDPQASATGWKDSRPHDTPAVVSAQAARLPQVLQAAAQAGAVLTLIPCRPAILDLRAISLTVDMTKLAGTPAAVVLNAVPPRGPLAEEACAAIAHYGVLLAPVRLGQRSTYVHALTAGQVAQEYEPHGKAADEITRLYRWTCQHVGLSSWRRAKK
jgi:chromosome partitioning protein